MQEEERTKCRISWTEDRVRREDMGAYLCIASNDVPPAVSKRIYLHVQCKRQRHEPILHIIDTKSRDPDSKNNQKFIM